MRAQHLILMLKTLYTYGKTNARELAAKLEVSERSIYRYVDELICAGIPIETERGYTGGFYIYTEGNV